MSEREKELERCNLELQRRLRESEQSKLDLLQQRAQESEQSKLELQQRAQEFEQSKLELQQRVQESQQSNLELQQRAQESEDRAAEERREKENERREKESERREKENERWKRQKAERQSEHERRKRREEEQRDQASTLVEYLRFHHQYLFANLTVQLNKELAAKGGLTDPSGRWYPQKLLPWDDFHRQQQDIFRRLYSLDVSNRVYDSEKAVEGQGRLVQGRPLAFEADLQAAHQTAFETPVTMIHEQWRQTPAIRAEFGLGRDGRVIFNLRAPPLSDPNEEVAERRCTPMPPSTPGAATRTPRPPRPDQVCLYLEKDGEGMTQRRLAYIIEDKAPHKLTLAHLRKGLRQDRVLDLQNDVIDRVTIPTTANDEEHFQHHSDRLVGAAITQTFSYMIETGARFGYLTTGEAMVFLHIPANDPGTVRYHLVEPAADVAVQQAEHPGEDYSHRTALGQILAFGLAALEAEPSSNAWQQQARQRLQRWAVDYDAILREIPESVRKASPPSSSYKPVAYRLAPRSPIRLRSMTNGCRSKPKETPGAADKYDSISSTSTHGERGAQKHRGQGVVASGRPKSYYCTHACLRGITEATRTMDRSCPNYASHPSRDGRHHDLDRDAFLQLFHQQFERTLDEDCQPLGCSGARGALFRVTLASHGYHLVAKGTVSAFVPDLTHEAAMYQQLRALQGVCVPMCLGNIDLAVPYYYDIGVQIVHMMFLSWAGVRIDQILPGSDEWHPHWHAPVFAALKQVHSAGVKHNDSEARNFLWDEREGGRLMVIDFERSTLRADEPPRALVPSGGNKRKRALADMEEEGTVKSRKVQDAENVMGPATEGNEALLSSSPGDPIM